MSDRWNDEDDEDEEYKDPETWDEWTDPDYDLDEPEDDE